MPSPPPLVGSTDYDDYDLDMITHLLNTDMDASAIFKSVEQQALTFFASCLLV
jgi:hypothetical protein